MTITAKVFMSGRSLALRLHAKEVRVEQIGNDLWLHPETPLEHDMGRRLQNFYASTESLPEDFLADRQDAPAQERDWSK